MDDYIPRVDASEDSQQGGLAYSPSPRGLESQAPSRRAPYPLNLSAWRAMVNMRAWKAVEKARFDSLLELRMEIRDSLDETGQYFENRPAKSQLGAVVTVETQFRLVGDGLQFGDEFRDRSGGWW